LCDQYNKIQNKLIILYAFFIPLSLDIMRILAISIIVLGFIQIYQNRSFFKHIIDIAFKLNLKIGFKYITRYWYILPMFFIFENIKKENISKVISSFLFGMMISEILSYSVFFEFIHIPHISPTDPSVFMHHTIYSVFLAFTMGILLDRILTTKHIMEKLIYIFFSLTITANLFINAGRTGQVIFIFILISIIISRSILNYKTILTTIFLSISIFYMAFLYSPNFKYRLEQTVTNIQNISYTTPIGSRIGLNIVAKDIFLANPLLGVGVGDYLSKKSEIIDKRYNTQQMQYVKYLEHYHNQYAEFLVIAGLLGLITYLSIWWSIYHICIRDVHIKTIKYILIVSFMLASLTDAFFPN